MIKELLDRCQEKVTVAENALHSITGIDTGDEELNYYLTMSWKKIIRANKRLKELRKEYNK